ncbi:MAG: PQQ-dependent dehydrogenase, methanol/ethanol family [Sphingomonadales bacterium]
MRGGPRRRLRFRWLAGLVSACLLAACSPSKDSDKDASGGRDFGARIVAADQEPQNWLATGRTYSEQHYSPLATIDRTNVGRLGLAWHHEFDTDRAQEGTPLVIDGVLYVATAWSKVFAFEAATGKLLWSYDPKVPGPFAFKLCCDAVNRGVAAWDGRIFVGVLDGRLEALDARTGKLVWSVQTTPPNSYASITGAPRVVDGLVVIGFGGADFGERGYVTAYDAATGKQAWRFYTVPGDPSQPFEQPELEAAARTWTGEWWKKGGGGTVWDSMAYDPESGLLYIGVGNGFPYSHKERSPGGGDNLYLSSIVALRARSGDYVWHYQTTPAETWDYTATQPMILADLAIGGKVRKVLMQAPKNGFFYVLDRTTGELLAAKNYVETRWASHVDMKTGRPVQDPLYRDLPILNMPGLNGAHNWQPMAWSPRTGLVYIPIHELHYAGMEGMPGQGDLTGQGGAAAKVRIPPESEFPSSGHLIAWDPAAMREAWRVDLGYPGNGGVLATGGDLVFQGATSGLFAAYDAATGQRLWQHETGNGIMAAPITFAVDGVQYVAILVGFGGGVGISHGHVTPKRPKLPGRLLVFRLDGTAVAKPPVWRPPAPLDLTGIEPPPGAAEGRTLFKDHCTRCHGVDAVAGTFPDLRYTPLILDGEAWKTVVMDGVLAQRGMVGFAGQFRPGDAEAIRAYLLGEARRVAGGAP